MGAGTSGGGGRLTVAMMFFRDEQMMSFLSKSKVRLSAVALFVSWHSAQLADGQCLVDLSPNEPLFLKGNEPKTRPKLQSKQGSFGF